jgi:hypothetical protein
MTPNVGAKNQVLTALTGVIERRRSVCDDDDVT